MPAAYQGAQAGQVFMDAGADHGWSLRRSDGLIVRIDTGPPALLRAGRQLEARCPPGQMHQWQVAGNRGTHRDGIGAAVIMRRAKGWGTPFGGSGRNKIDY